MKHLAKVGLMAGIAGALSQDAVQRSKFSFRDRSVLVTGGSRGLGLLIVDIMNALLPKPLPVGDSESRSGWESRSALSPSLLTRLADRATQENNEYRLAS
jgi:hypothetical protein